MCVFIFYQAMQPLIIISNFYLGEI